MNLIDSTTRPASTSVKEGIAGLQSSVSAVPSDGPSFAQIWSDFGGIITPIATPIATSIATTSSEQPGQELAASDPSLQALLEGSYALNAPNLPLGVPLQSISLGPHLSAITSKTEAPDPLSLAAFARSQGLGDQAIQWLLGNPTQDKPMPEKSLGGIATPPLGLVMAATPSVTLADRPQADMQASLSGSIGRTQIPGALIGDSVPYPVGTVMGTTPIGSIGAPPLSAPGWNTAAPPPITLASAMPAAALWALAEVSDAPSKSTDTPADATDPDLQASLLRMAPPAATWMQRLAQQSPAPSFQKAGPDNFISVSELILGQDFELTDDALMGETTSSPSATGPHPPTSSGPAHPTHKHALHLPTTAPGLDTADAAQRSDNIQNLADKMGQAVGQRILSEMEKGQWHLKLLLRPATLGHIEVEMRMRSGEFDAVFTAPVAATRELLQDGMGRLRNTLSEMGMDVASIQVGNDKNSKSGEESTPGHPRSSPAERTQETGPSDPQPATVQRLPRRTDGLDVMV